MFGYEIGKFCSGKMMRKLTKQACCRYDESAFLGGCDAFFVGAKIIHHNSLGGLLYLNPILEKTDRQH